MRYVANRILHVTPQGSEERTTYRPGDPIPGFESWPHANRKALLDADHVKFDFDPAVWVHRGDRPALQAALGALEAPQQATPPPPPALPLPQASAGTQDALSETGVDDADTDVEFFDGACDLCPRTFANPRALKQHRTKSHGGL